MKIAYFMVNLAFSESENAEPDELVFIKFSA